MMFFMEGVTMKKLFTLFLAIAVLTTAAAAFAENTATDTSSIPQ